MNQKEEEKLSPEKQAELDRQIKEYLGEMMRIILPIERKLQSRPRFARRGNYVQTYEDSAMGAYKQKAKPELIEKGLFLRILRFTSLPLNIY